MTLHTRKQPSVSAAARQFNLSPFTVHYWVRQGYVRVTRTATSIRVHQGDLARVASIHNRRKASGIKGGSMFREGRAIVTQDQLLAPRPETQRTSYQPALPADFEQRLPRRATFSELEGTTIALSEATRRYAIPRSTVEVWKKNGYVRVVDSSRRPELVDAADMAFIAAIYRERKASGIKSSVPMFLKDGTPVIDIAQVHLERQRAKAKAAK